MSEMQVPKRLAERCKLGVVLWDRLGFQVQTRENDQLDAIMEKFRIERRAAVVVPPEERELFMNGDRFVVVDDLDFAGKGEV